MQPEIKKQMLYVLEYKKILFQVSFVVSFVNLLCDILDNVCPPKRIFHQLMLSDSLPLPTVSQDCSIQLFTPNHRRLNNMLTAHPRIW